MNKQTLGKGIAIIVIILTIVIGLITPVKAECLCSCEAMSDVTNDEEQLTQLTSEEFVALCQVVAAEAGYQSAEAQKNVVWVILNRVNDERFGDTVSEVIYAPGQFTCVSNKAYKIMDITPFIIENVFSACQEYKPGESAEGALYFCKGKMKRDFLFQDEVKHNFFK